MRTPVRTRAYTYTPRAAGNYKHFQLDTSEASTPAPVRAGGPRGGLG